MLYKKVPFIQQMSELDCGAACLTMILHYYNNRVPLFEVSRKCSFSRNGLTLKGIIEISMSYGLESRAYKLFDDYGIKNFKEYLPAILLNKKGHYVVLEEINKRHIVIVDPEIGKRKISVNENLQDYFEAIVILKKTSEFVEKKHYINNVTLAIKQNMGSLKKLWGSIILSFAIEVCSLILPICTQIIIDVAIGRGNYDIILLVFLLGIGAVLLYGVLSYLKSNIILSMSYDFWKNFSEDIIKKLFHLPISYFDIRSSGDISNRINNINLIKDTMARIGNSLIINCLSILVFGIAMMCMSIRLSLVIYGIAIFQAVFFYFCMKHTRRLMHENLERQEVTYTYLLEVLKNILFIKSSDSSIDSINQWREIFSQQMTTSSHKEKFSNLFQCILMVLKLTPSILLLALGSYEIAAERLSLGGLMALVSIGSMFINPVSALANDMQDIVYLRSVLERLMEIYYAEKEENINKKGIEKEIQRIQLTNVSFKYFKSGENILKRINISIKRGEKIAIVGKTGCGKSTLIKLILGLYKPTEGQLMIDGNKITELDVNDYRKHIGITMQEAYFFDDTIEKNIDISKKCEKMQIQKAAQMARLDQDISCMEKGYETRIGENGKNLSGGQRQRVALGRAIVKDQKVFLMDEPLSNLDAKLRVSMRNEISKLHRNLGSTTIYVTHDQVEAMTMADRIVIMKDGVIQQVGKPMDLYEHPVNKFVAGFIGSPQMNFYDVKVDGKKLIFADGNTVELPEAIAKRIAGYSEVIMGIRGEDIKFDITNLDVYGSHQKAVIDNTEIMGNENNLYFDFGGSVTIARVSKYEVSQVGDEVEFTFMPHKMHFFDKETEQVIGAE